MALDASEDGWPIVECETRIDALVVSLTYTQYRSKFQCNSDTIHMLSGKLTPTLCDPHHALR